MKKQLLFLLLAVVFFVVPSQSQSNGPNAGNTSQIIAACDLNLTHNLPSVNSQCSVAYADLVIPVITDSCGNTVTPTTDGSIFPITATGTTIIVWEYVNELGGIETQDQDVNILDFTNPVVDIAILPNFHSQCAVQQADLPVPMATDNCSGMIMGISDAVFPITISTLITWNYVDASGNTTYQTQDIYINDFTEPVADVAILPNIHAPCKVEETDVAFPTATDNCGGLVTVTHDVSFPIVASTLITWTYTDANGNASYQTQDVYIDDYSQPVANVAVLPSVHAFCQVESADLTIPTATDNCTTPVIVTNDATFPIVTSTLITWTYSDASGNTSYQTQDIIIDDTTSPVPDDAVLADVISQCALSPTDLIVPTATDNCSVASVTNNGIFPIAASTIITWTYTDNNGNSVSQPQRITIADTMAPTPDNAILADISAQCEVLQADITTPTATDNCTGLVTVSNDASFPITASTTIIWTYTDSNGNSVSQAQNVIVNDTTAPTPDAITLADITAQCELFEVDVIAPTATDNCSGIVTVTSDGIFPITASTTITWTYTDANGNNSFQTQNVVVNDTIAPTPDAITLADITAQCELLESNVIAPTATDNCTGLVTVTNDGVFPITASTTITWTYTDANGNNSSQTQNVVVNDTIAPTPDAAILADITGQCEVLEVDVTAPTATDNCSGIVTVTNDGVFPITASTIITWTYADANGNNSTQIQNVIINDNTAPTPDVAALADVSAPCQVLEADVTLPTATDNCSSVIVTGNGVFPINASTTITWTYTDANGNIATQIQNVIINDAIAPTPDNAILADITAQCEVLETDLTVPTATDNCSAVTVTNDATFPITASSIITWIYTDANGNSTSQSQNIMINDMTAPIPDATILADVNSQCTLLEVNLAIPTATDNCSVVTVTNDGVFPITGSTTITWTYTDANGNTATQTQNVVIANDTTPPTPDAAALTDITAQCQVLQADVNVPTATDNCSTVTVTNDATFPITAQGVTTITWTYTDGNGNIATQTQDVLIGDNTAPTVTLSDITVSVDVTGTVIVTAAQLENGTANDNCGIASITVTPNTFTCTDLGSHAVAVTVTDIHGNSTVQSATVTVTDPTDFCTALGIVHNEKSAFAIYPNPTSDMIYIEGNNKAVYTIKLYALSGQLVLQKSYNQNAERYGISLASLPQGTYLLKLETAEGTSTKRVIKY